MPQALGAFIEQAYADAKVDPDEIDTGALILTGVAVRRRNARADRRIVRAARPASWSRSAPATAWRRCSRPTAPARWRARSATDATVMNVDVGGGTAKIAVCARRQGGRRSPALDVGARLVCARRRGPHRADRAGRAADSPPSSASRSRLARCSSRRRARALAARMADRLFAAMRGRRAAGRGHRPDAARAAVRRERARTSLSFSGGVAEYIYGGEREILRRPRPHAGG